MHESIPQGALDLPPEQKESLTGCLRGAALAQMSGVREGEPDECPRRRHDHVWWLCWTEQARGSDASATESLRAHVANGTHRVTRAMLTDEPQPFWEYWEGRLPEVTEDDLWGPEAMSILV
ncbi:MAG: hypothetical protein Q4A07_04010 [Coriobacteriales bacterium]|nr:hypothetical protein [Coriobacteriales bacterium]